MGISPGARFPERSADALPVTLYGHFTQAIYRNRPIELGAMEPFSLENWTSLPGVKLLLPRARREPGAYPLRRRAQLLALPFAAKHPATGAQTRSR